MKLHYASTFVFALLVSPGVQAWGLDTSSLAGIGQSPSTQDPAPSRNKIPVRAFPVAKSTVSSKAKPLARVSKLGNSNASANVAETIIPLRQPSLLEQARSLTQGEILAKFDIDLDGKLNPKEASAARRETEMRKGLKAGLLKRFDDNKNARLDAAEMSRARAEFAANRRKQVLGKYDSNRNGLLDPAERKCLQTDRQRAAAHLDLQKRFDLNHDNRLDSREAAALRSFTAEKQGNTRVEMKRRAGHTNAGAAKPAGKPRGQGATVESSAKPEAPSGGQTAKDKAKVQSKTLRKGPTKGKALPKSGS